MSSQHWSCCSCQNLPCSFACQRSQSTARGTLPQSSSKSNNPASAIPTSGGSVNGGRGFIVMAFLGLKANILRAVQF
ncbi:hypothetical protein Peur_019956 [Populus x canadensis]